MTDRERLLKILNVPIHPHENVDPLEAVADFLLDNGVTFATDNNVGSKWIPVTERLPEKGETVITLGSRGGVYTAQYTGGRYWHKLNAKCHMCEPTHWMPLPEPPKEIE